jgi:hypothetical protein
VKVGGSNPPIPTNLINNQKIVKMENMYKQANKLALRIPTVKGHLSIEQIFTLKRSEIAQSIKNLKKVMGKTEDSDLDFLEEGKTVNVIAELSFNILKDIYLTLNDEAKTARDAQEKKEHNQKILNLIAEKQEEGLKGKTIEELEALLKQ